LGHDARRMGERQRSSIVTMQDILGLGSAARMNTPSTLGNNWKWRARKEDITPQLARKTRKYTELYGRVRKK